MGTVTNVPQAPLKWSIRRAAAEFKISIPTLIGKLNAVEEKPDADKTFATAQIVRALFGDLHALRLRKAGEEGDKVALANQITRGEFLSRRDLEAAFLQIALGVKEVVRGSGLSQEAQMDVMRQIASIPVAIRDRATARARTRDHGENGNGNGSSEKRKRGRPKKAVGS